jgi:N6-adenosine-specific RNA methylase IME4
VGPVTKVPEALTVCDAWDFRYVGLLTWVTPGLGLGSYRRVSTENVVFGVRRRLATRPHLRNWFEAKRARHSAKPDEFHTLVGQASPGPISTMRARGG